MPSGDKYDEVYDGRPPLNAALFGVFELATPEGKAIPISNRRARAILAMLCLVPEHSFSRRYLSKLLWPSRFEAQARGSLRQCLSDLGKLLAPFNDTLLQVDRSRVSLNTAKITIDLSEVETALAKGQIDAAIAGLSRIENTLILDQLLFGPEFDVWLSTQRENAQRRLQVALHAALAQLEDDGEKTQYSELLTAWERHDPNGAQKVSVSRNERKIPLAVLPFKFVNESTGRDYLADGIVDELITSLGQTPELLVAGRISSFHFKDTDLSSSGIAEALRVAYLVEGSVQLQGNDIRINVRLIDGITGFEVWSHRYDGNVENIFALQDSVSQAVTRELGLVLDLAITTPKPRKMSPNKAAYDLYLQGRALISRPFGLGILDTAISLLEEALKLDPDFAECWTALAEAHVYKAVYTPCLDRQDQCEKMAECARKAMILAPGQGHARAMLGIHKWTKNDIVGALDLAFEAYRLEPNNPDVVIRLGSFLLYCGRTEQALPYIESAIDQDPVHGRNFAILTTVYLNLGRLDDAIAAGQRMVDLGYPSMWLSIATAANGQHDQAVEQYRQTRLLMNTVIFPPAGSTPLEPEMMDAYWEMAAKGVCSGAKQDRQTYCNMLDMLQTTLPDKCDTTIVQPAVWMGYAEMVFKTLGQTITPANFYVLQSLWADIEPIRQTRLHPDFMSFAKRIGMVAAWEKYGWPDLLPRS